MGRSIYAKKTTEITCLFLDIGGVLLTDGWGHVSRKLATKAFNLNPEEFESWHNQAFDTYELDKLTIEEYLSRVVFYEERPFTPAQFRKFMFAQSKSVFFDRIPKSRLILFKEEPMSECH